MRAKLKGFACDERIASTGNSICCTIKYDSKVCWVGPTIVGGVGDTTNNQEWISVKPPKSKKNNYEPTYAIHLRREYHVLG